MIYDDRFLSKFDVEIDFYDSCFWKKVTSRGFWKSVSQKFYDRYRIFEKKWLFVAKMLKS
jgi:hypothetical protein